MSHTHEELLQHLWVVRNFTSLRELSLQDALFKAREVEADRIANYRYWAQHRFKSETAFCAARDLLSKIELVIEVLQAGIEEETATTAYRAAEQAGYEKAKAGMDEEEARVLAQRATEAELRAHLATRNAQTPQTPTDAPQTLAAIKETPAPKSDARCPHFPAIKRAYAIAREAGLDTKADAAMRAAFSRVLGRPINSREELDGAEWTRIGDEIKLWGLKWETA